MTQYYMERASTESFDGFFDNSHVAQGRILWLPGKKDLPERAVRRAHGKGAIEEGIYNHPVVVISRPDEENHSIHFHLITSLQGKRLDQLYSKSNEFHASRRSWYLPIAPTPDHPDALSKKTKKRFPTLELADDATLRWDSYVNIRHVYKIDLSLLRPYSNPETPDVEYYAFKQESMIRMLAKGKTLTMYEPGSQFASIGLVRIKSEPVYIATHNMRIYSGDEKRSRSPASDGGIIAPPGHSRASPASSVDFRIVVLDGGRKPGPPPKVPPDSEKQFTSIPSVVDGIIRPLNYFLENAKSITTIKGERLMETRNTLMFDIQPISHIWRDLKGATAVVIASM